MAPRYHVPRAGLGRALAAGGRTGEAIAQYRRAVELLPDPAYLSALGDLYAERGDEVLARQQYETVEAHVATYVEAARKGGVPAEHFEGWEQGVRALYDQMAQITIEPDWAKLLDFETTIPKAVEDLIHAKMAER